MNTIWIIVTLVLLFKFVNSIDYDYEETTTEFREILKIDADRGSQIWKMYSYPQFPRSILTILENAYDVEVLNGDRTSLDVFIQPNQLKSMSNLLNKSNIHYDIVVKDVRPLLERENESLMKLAFMRDRKLKPYEVNHFRSQFHTAEDINNYLEYLAKTYEFCSVQVIGFTEEHRPIKLLVISNNRPGNKKIFVDSGMHAREWMSQTTVLYIINRIVSEFLESYELKLVTWYILPVFNPDGYEYTRKENRFWRKNRRTNDMLTSRCHGVDLNRNFEFKWLHGTFDKTCSDSYPGLHGFSELETNAVKNFIIENLIGLEGYVSFHSYGRRILLPWAYTSRRRPKNYRELRYIASSMIQEVRTATGARYLLATGKDLLYPIGGTSMDWMKSMDIRLVFAIELDNNIFIDNEESVVRNGIEGYTMLRTVLTAIAK